MLRPIKQFEIGVRWLGCGWRLFLRDPWQLGGMGLAGAGIIIVLARIPLLGGLLIALLTPIFLASTYLEADDASKRKRALPPSWRTAVLKRVPLDLLSVFNNEERVMPMFVLSLYSMAVVVLINILAHLITNGVWAAGSWLSLGIGALLANLGTVLLLLVLYFLLASSIVYALPLAFLQDEPLIPAMRLSLRMSLRHAFALLVIPGLLLGLYFLGVLLALWSLWVCYLVWLAAGMFVLPLAVTSAYCSYRTVFPKKVAHPA
jgi:hypothetical protein